MTTFARKAFNAAVYSQSRPTYPSELFEYIFSFHRQGSQVHQAKWERAVDLGCGTGQATTHLHYFSEVIGIDPSKKMLDKARVYLDESWNKSNSPVYKLLVGSSEDLRQHLADDSVDLLIAAQACHWFDWKKVWPETNRVLRRGGTAAFWVYTEFRLSQFPSLTSLISGYVQGSDPFTNLGPYFQRPGRTILERYLVDVPEPSDVLGDDGLSDMKRVFFCGSEIPPFLPNDAPKFPILLRRVMTWRDLLGYFRTMSALLSYHETFPEDLNAEEDVRFLNEDLAAAASGSSEDIRGGDISIRFWKDLRQGVLGVSPTSTVGLNDDIEVHWPVALLLVRKG